MEKSKSRRHFFIYITSPISRIVGYAKVSELRFSSLARRNSRRKGKVSIEDSFRKLRALSEEEWIYGIKPYGMEIRHGINPVHEETKVNKLADQIESLLGKR